MQDPGIAKFFNVSPEAATRVLKNLSKFTGKHLCWNLFINKVSGWRPASLLKKCLHYWCFLMNFAKFLRTAFRRNTYRKLLLSVVLKNQQFINFKNKPSNLKTTVV